MRNRDYTFSNTVWIESEDIFGVLIAPMGAFFSEVFYSKNGIDFEVILENDEFMTMEEVFDDDDD